MFGFTTSGLALGGPWLLAAATGLSDIAGIEPPLVTVAFSSLLSFCITCVTGIEPPLCSLLISVKLKNTRKINITCITAYMYRNAFTFCNCYTSLEIVVHDVIDKTRLTGTI